MLYLSPQLSKFFQNLFQNSFKIHAALFNYAAKNVGPYIMNKIINGNSEKNIVLKIKGAVLDLKRNLKIVEYFGYNFSCGMLLD